MKTAEQHRPDLLAKVWRLLVVSDKQAFAEALVESLSAASQLEVTGRVPPALAAAEARRSRPGLIVIACDHAVGIAALTALSHVVPLPRSVAVGVRADVRRVLAWAQAGACGCLTEEASMSEIVSACCRAARGETVCSDSVGTTLFRRASAAPSGLGDPSPLTFREREVIQLVALRLSNKEIAANLGVEVSTVKNHLHRIYEKLGLNRRTEASDWWATWCSRELAPPAVK